MRKLTAVVSIAALTACAGLTQKATGLPLPKERAAECATHCETLGMKLSAVVIIMSSVGCVCEPKGSTPGASAAPGAAAAGGGAAIAVAAAAAAQHQQQQSASMRAGVHPATPPGVPR